MGCLRFGCIYQNYAAKMPAFHVHGACSCTVVYLGGSYASGALSAFVRVSRHKTSCMYHLSHCFLLVFVFCLINIFRVQVQVQVTRKLFPFDDVIMLQFIDINITIPAAWTHFFDLMVGGVNYNTTELGKYMYNSGCRALEHLAGSVTLSSP